MNLPQFCFKGLKLAGLVALCAVALYAQPDDGGGSKGRGACCGKLLHWGSDHHRQTVGCTCVAQRP